MLTLSNEILDTIKLIAEKGLREPDTAMAALDTICELIETRRRQFIVRIIPKHPDWGKPCDLGFYATREVSEAFAKHPDRKHRDNGYVVVEVPMDYKLRDELIDAA